MNVLYFDFSISCYNSLYVLDNLLLFSKIYCIISGDNTAAILRRESSDAFCIKSQMYYIIFALFSSISR